MVEKVIGIFWIRNFVLIVGVVLLQIKSLTKFIVNALFLSPSLAGGRLVRKHCQRWDWRFFW